MQLAIVSERMRRAQGLLLDLSLSRCLLYAASALACMSLLSLSSDWWLELEPQFRASDSKLWDQVRKWPALPAPRAGLYVHYAFVSNAIAAGVAIALLAAASLVLQRLRLSRGHASMLAIGTAMLAIAVLAAPVGLLQEAAKIQQEAVREDARRAARDVVTLLGPSILIVSLPTFLASELIARDRLILLLGTLSIYFLAVLGQIGAPARRANNELLALVVMLLASALLSWLSVRSARQAELRRQEAEAARQQATLASEESNRAREAAVKALGQVETTMRALDEERERYRQQSEAAVTHVRQLEDRLQSYQSNRANFIGTAAHNLGQPLTAVMLWSDNLSRCLAKGDGDSAAQHLATLQAEVAALGQAFTAVLEYSNIEAGRVTPTMRPHRLDDIFIALERRFTLQAAQRSLSLSFERPHASCLVLTDPNLLLLALSNLVANAIKYTPARSPRRRGSDVLVRPVEMGLRVAVEVVDRGVGIPEGLYRKIFQPGFRGEGTNERGYGLGLASVESVVRKALGAGHDVAVKSEVGVGSTFSVEIPKAFVDVDAVMSFSDAEAVRPRHGQVLEGALIAVVEDEGSLRRAICSTLDLAGAFVLEGADLGSILGAIDANSDRRPDVIVTDFHLGSDQDGRAVIEAIRGRCARPLPAILFTADQAQAQEAVEGMDDVIVLQKSSAGSLVSQLARFYTPMSSPLEQFTSGGQT